MAGFVRVVAFDLDGTLVHGAAPSADVLEALESARADGLSLILVTGRIDDEMQAEFPRLTDHFDAVVTENGGVLQIDGVSRTLAPPVEPALAGALAAHGVQIRSGRVLLAGSAADTDLVLAEVTRLGLDCQLLRNRGELMVLPSGVSKGTGLVAALDELGLSVHNTLALGDAENDLALLEAAEVGVAVANAVPSLKQHADLILDGVDGEAVAEFLRGPLVHGLRALRPERRRLGIGRFSDGDPAVVPGAQANILVCGPSGAGKSHLAGLLVEQWVTAGYSVLVIDLEGDHVGLGRLRNTVILGDGGRLPSAQELVTVLRTRRVSVVLDLSATPSGDRAEYLGEVAAVVEAERAVSGIPHWIVVDEAHQTLGEAGVATEVFRPADLGYCLITYVPEQLSATARAAIDLTLRVTSGPLQGMCPTGSATLRETGGPEREFVLAQRRTPHRRHWHKYAAQVLPPHRWFRFRDPGGGEPHSARDVAEFAKELLAIDPVSAEYHLCRGDFSRWVVGSLQDRELGAALAVVERDLLARRARDVQRARERVLAEVADRYDGPLGDVNPAPTPRPEWHGSCSQVTGHQNRPWGESL